MRLDSGDNGSGKSTKQEIDEALFMSGLRTLQTGVQINDPELIRLSDRQFELAAKDGMSVAEFFRQIIYIRLSEHKNPANFSDIAESLFDILHDPSLEYMFPKFLGSFVETLEAAHDRKQIKLSTILEPHSGTIDEILELLKELAKEKLTDPESTLSKLYFSIRLFLNSLADPDPDQI